MFLLSQNDENQSENGSKNSKIRLRARPPAEPQKKMLQTKKLRSKSWKTRVFFTFRLPILDGRVHEQVSSVLFFTVFFEGERHDLSKTGGFGRKMPPPPPGKPVTFLRVPSGRSRPSTFGALVGYLCEPASLKSAPDSSQGVAAHGRSLFLLGWWFQACRGWCYGAKGQFSHKLIFVFMTFVLNVS